MTSTFDDMLTMIKQKSDPYTFIASFFPAIFWLSEIYLEMWRMDEITALKDLSEERKRFYWSYTNRKQKKWMRILACRAFLAWDKIKQDAANSNAAGIMGEVVNNS